VEWFEPAFHYGGPESGNSETAGADCPGGMNQLEMRKELVTAYRSQETVDALLNPEYRAKGGDFYGPMGFWGVNRENIYEN